MSRQTPKDKAQLLKDICLGKRSINDLQSRHSEIWEPKPGAEGVYVNTETGEEQSKEWIEQCEGDIRRKNAMIIL